MSYDAQEALKEKWRQAAQRYRLRHPDKVKAKNQKQRAYRARRETRHKIDMRARLNEIKVSLGCVDCGYKANAVALDFDHVTGEKRKPVSQMAQLSWAEIVKEMDKCEVRCANCHRIRTFAERQHITREVRHHVV